MVYTCFYHLSGSHQHRRNVDSPNHRLFYYPFCSPAAYLRRLPVLYGIYFHCPAFTSDYLINYSNMETLNKNGVSVTQTPGEEKTCKMILGVFRECAYYQ